MISKWELVSESDDAAGLDQTVRMEVPGGWMYQSNFYRYIESGKKLVASAACFVPQPPEVLPARIGRTRKR